MKRKMDIVYRLAVKEDSQAILKFLREHFYPDEPLTSSVEPKEKTDSHDEDFIMDNVATPNRICLLALNDNEIVGVGISAPKALDEEQKMLEEASQIPGTKWAKLLVFLAALENKSNVFKKYNTNKVMHGHCLAVHSKFRGTDIAVKLYDKSMQITKILEYPLYTSDCTSSYSARLSERLGMECINVCNMDEYRAPGSDKQVFFLDEDHKYTKTYVKSML